MKITFCFVFACFLKMKIRIKRMNGIKCIRGKEIGSHIDKIKKNTHPG